MASVGFILSSENSGAGGVGSVAFPVGTAVGDTVLLIANVVTTEGMQSPPVGWAPLALSNDVNGSDTLVAVYAKAMTSADIAAGSVSVGWSFTEQNYPYNPYSQYPIYPTLDRGRGGGDSGPPPNPPVWNLVALTYRASAGVTVTIDTVSAVIEHVGGPASSPSVTTTIANDQVVSIVFGASATSVPGGWTSRVSSIPTPSPSILVADNSFAATGATGAATWGGGGTSAGVTIALGAFGLAPSAPQLTAPTNSSAVDATAPIPLAAIYEPNNGAAMNAFALRVKVEAGAYQYLRTSDNTLQATIQWNALVVAAGGTISVTIPANLLANGHTDAWSINTQESAANTQGSFATDWTFTTSAAPTVSATGPTGTQVTPQPAVTWTTTPAAGNVQTYWRVILYTAVQYGIGGFTPGVSPSTYDTAQQPGGTASFVIPFLLANTTTYRAYIQIQQTNGMLSAWVYSGFNVAFDGPAIPTILAIAGSDPTTGQPRVVVTAQGSDNQGTANQSSVELGTTAGFVALTNTTIAASSTWASDGTYSLRLTATAGGAIGAQWTGGTGGCLIVQGQPVTAWAVVRSAATARVCSLGIAFYDVAGGFISDPVVASASDSASVDTPLSGSIPWASVPTNAVYAVPIVGIAACAGSEIHYADKWGLFPGVVSAWTVGGNLGGNSVEVQSSPDGGVTWADLRFGASVALSNPGQSVIVVDDEAIPGTTMTYQARTLVVFDGIPLTSSWSPAASALVSCYPRWCLSNPLVQGSGVLFDLSANPTDTWRQVDTEYDPLSRAHGIKMSDGFKGSDWALSIRTTNLAQEQALKALVTSARYLLLQHPLGGQTYGFVVGSPAAAFTYDSGFAPSHDISLVLRECDLP
jgi:hypothetical protein